MRVLVLAFALALLPALAAAEESCADKCETEMKACDKKNCWPDRNDCVQSKCTGPKDIRCRRDCIKESEPCLAICTDARAKCDAACPKS